METPLIPKTNKANNFSEELGHFVHIAKIPNLQLTHSFPAWTNQRHGKKLSAKSGRKSIGNYCFFFFGGHN